MSEISDHVPPTYWALVLRDWMNCQAQVTIHLRGGQTVYGRVTGLPPSQNCVDLQDYGARRETKHTVSLVDIAAVTAEGR
jgi:hypothetical protein